MSDGGSAPQTASEAPLLARYQSLFVIGRGGMGTVEAAVERGAAGSRVVALKRLLPHVKDRRHVDMFLREARLAALLDHKNVVHALAYGEHEGELLFAMEYVEGETLATLLDRKRALPPHVAAWLLADLCEGLHAAHELCDVGGAPLGVVHRDVSPHNVMLSYTGDVKLLDFGVAKLQGTTHLTKTGEVKGKTAYMSPEQASGDPLDRRSDLYSVGAILFELVAGHRMWPGETDIDFLRQLALAEAPSLAEAMTPPPPPELCALQARLTSKDREGRPANALEVAEELRRFAGLAHEPRNELVRLLVEVFGAESAAKHRRLEEALSRAPSRHPNPSNQDHADANVNTDANADAGDGDAHNGGGAEPVAVIAPASPRRPSRAPPWIYGVVGAALATLAVLLLAKSNAPPPAPAASPIAAQANPMATSTNRQASLPSVAASPPSALASSDPATPLAASIRHARPHMPARTLPPRTSPPPARSGAVHPRPVIDVDPNPI